MHLNYNHNDVMYLCDKLFELISKFLIGFGIKNEARSKYIAMTIMLK